MNISKTRKLTATGMLCALAYVAVLVGRIPLVLFLKYDPKDVVIVIGGFIFGPLTSLAVSLIVSVVQMVTISANGILGCMMNVISSCSFACTAAYVYKKKRTLSGALFGLFCGCVCQVVTMMPWNYLLLPAFLPFNVIKGGLNAAITMILYKPVVTVLRRSDLIGSERDSEKMRINIGVLLAALMVIATCVLWILSINNFI